MKQLYVSASLYYNYIVDVPDDFDLDSEADLQNYLADRDPFQFTPSSAFNVSGSIDAVFDNDTDELLYNWN